jgi:hypothetical protein
MIKSSSALVTPVHAIGAAVPNGTLEHFHETLKARFKQLCGE